MEDFAAILAALRAANDEYAHAFPGDPAARQPVHTVYGGAHLFRADTARKLGGRAIETLERHAPDAATFARVLSLSGDPADLYERVRAKLRREPVEDFRIDFEDGYGVRSDAEEDADARRCASEVVRAIEAGSLPPFLGIRTKPFTNDFAPRALRTLELFLTGLEGRLPANFVVTIPKPTHPAQVEALARTLDYLEPRAGLPRGAVRVDLMIETPQSLFVLRDLVRAANGRCVSAAFGTYDFTAAMGITAEFQDMNHPACDFARLLMRAAYAQTGLMLSDGATNILPVGDTQSVHRAWALQARHIRRSLELGFTQGWDLHPAQLPARYAVVYEFFRRALPQQTDRLKAFVAQAARASLKGDVFDDAATGLGMINYFLRGLACGALDESDVAATGLRPQDLAARSFARIPGLAPAARGPRDTEHTK
jgi:citrate lyase beta subunit